MSIERLIYGSLPLGIESEQAGFQEYSYTSGYPALKAENKDIHGRITTMYKPPETISYSDWYNEKVFEKGADFLERVRLANQASDQASVYHPASLTFYHETINGVDKLVFVYAKGMIEWAMRGGQIAAYHNAVICDAEYLMKYPVLYCSSSVVCCDIKREAFFPTFAVKNEEAKFDTTKLVKPKTLGYLSSLDSPNDVCLAHQAGFKAITIPEIVEFIRSNENLQLLKSMVSSLIQLKEGDTKKRIVIADEKNNIILWIAAVSFVFPIVSASNISFTTYGYSVKDFDINGVFVNELNNSERIADTIPATDYDYTKLQQTYSVYDFYEQSFGTNVEVYDNLFMSLIENAFTINNQILEQYKEYIVNTTTYKKIDARYMDGAILFMFVSKNKHLSSEQIKKALEFSKEYSIQSEKKNVLLKLIQQYKQYISDNIAMDEIINYIRHCVSVGIVQQNQVETVFMRDVKDSFLDYENVSFDAFSEQGHIAEKLCGFTGSFMEVTFVKTIGLDQLLGIMDSLYERKDIQRISYIHTAVAHYVNDGKGSFRDGNIEQKIASKIINVLINDESSDSARRLDALVSKTNQIISSSESQFFYSDAVYQTLFINGFKQLSKRIALRVAETYLLMTAENRKHLVSIIQSSGKAKVYLPLILARIGSCSDLNEKVSILNAAISNNSSEFSPYITHLRKLGVTTDGVTVTSDYYYNVFLFLKNCEKIYKIPVSDSEITNLMENYTECLYSEHRDLYIPEEKMYRLKMLNQEYQKTRNKGKCSNLVCAFLLIEEMNASTMNKGNCVFNGFNPNTLVDYSALSSAEQQSLIASISGLIATYWLNTKNLPVFHKIFSVSDRADIMETYSYLFAEILEYVINSSSKNRSEVMVSVIEYAVFLKLSRFLEDSPEMLVYKVKQGDIVKPLEKDLEAKIHLKVKDGLLAEIETTDLQKQLGKIKEAYEQKSQNSPLGKAKQAFGNFMSGFKKGKKDD